MNSGKPSRRWQSVVGWNVLFLSACAALIFIDWEAWFHLRPPITERHWPTRFEPGAGLLHEPGAQARWPYRGEVWAAQRANRWGFLDREPPPPEQAARTCHIAFIGDSFVEAKEVPIADKFHVRLEELAARSLPRLNISTSAFGRRATGQINQLPFYDKYARELRPKLVVLVFVHNDLMDNHGLLAAMFKGWDPDRAPYVVAEKTAAGAIALRPPDPAWQMLPISSAPLEGGSPALRWLRRKTERVPGTGVYGRKVRLRAELLVQRPRYQSVMEAILSGAPESLSANGYELLQDPALPLGGEAVEFTAFALDEFQRRVAADGASLWLFLATTTDGWPQLGGASDPNRVVAEDLAEARGMPILLGDASDPFRIVLEDLAEARGMPVVSMHDYLVRQGRRIYDGVFPFDGHWSPAGHQWVAEALLERLQQRPEVCGVSGA